MNYPDDVSPYHPNFTGVNAVENLCNECEGTGRNHTYSYHECYSCNGTGEEPVDYDDDDDDYDFFND